MGGDQKRGKETGNKSRHRPPPDDRQGKMPGEWEGQRFQPLPGMKRCMWVGMGREIPENNPLLTRPIGPQVIWPLCLISFPTTHFSPSPKSLHHIALFSDASPSLLCLVHSNPLFREAFHDHLVPPHCWSLPTFHLVATMSLRISVCSVPETTG